jgi:hypothetical protein
LFLAGTILGPITDFGHTSAVEDYCETLVTELDEHFEEFGMFPEELPEKDDFLTQPLRIKLRGANEECGYTSSGGKFDFVVECNIIDVCIYTSEKRFWHE